MSKINPSNARITHGYCEYLKEARQLDESTIDEVTKAISRYEEHTSYRDFKAFKKEDAVSFKHDLLKQKSKTTGKKLSKSTVHSTLKMVKKFFEYLFLQHGFRSKITFTDIEYFNLSRKETKIANTNSKKPIPTVNQITQVLEVMPFVTDIEKRDRALIALTLLTGARDSAVATLKLKHINITEEGVYQDAREVDTKFSKTISTYFFPVGDRPFQIVTEWVEYLTQELNYSPEDPLFPKTKMGHNTKKEFVPTGLLKEHWSTTNSIRRIFRKAFQLAGLPYFNPHSFRKTLVRLGEELCKNPKEFKAWSQNLGHESVLTTFYNYGEVPDHEQAKLIKKLAEPRCDTTPPEIETMIQKTLLKILKNAEEG